MLLIALRATSVILGNKKPLEVLCISKAAEACGFEVPIPTCARILKFKAIKTMPRNGFLEIFIFFLKLSIKKRLL